MNAPRFLVNIDVPNLATATRFYCEALGLTAGRRFGPHAQELVGGPTDIYLLKKDAGTPSAPSDATDARDYARHWSPVRLDFVIDDIDAAKAQALAAGATLEADTSAHRWGKLAMFADPWAMASA